MRSSAVPSVIFASPVLLLAVKLPCFAAIEVTLAASLIGTSENDLFRKQGRHAAMRFTIEGDW
jgi:hypothetical protein